MKSILIGILLATALCTALIYSAIKDIEDGPDAELE